MSRGLPKRRTGNRASPGAGEKAARPSAPTGGSPKRSNATHGRSRAVVTGARRADKETGRVATDDASEGNEPGHPAEHVQMTEEEADRLVTEALECDLNDPEPFVKMLLILHDEENDLELRESVYRLMIAAYSFNKFEGASGQFPAIP